MTDEMLKRIESAIQSLEQSARRMAEAAEKQSDSLVLSAKITKGKCHAHGCARTAGEHFLKNHYGHLCLDHAYEEFRRLSEEQRHTMGMVARFDAEREEHKRRHVAEAW